MFEIVSGNLQRDWMKECEFTLARSANDLFDFVSKAQTQFGEDFETTGLNLEKDRVVGFSCAYDEKHGLYYPISHLVGSELNLPAGPLVEVLRSLDARPKPFSNVWWNYAGFDGPMMQKDFGFYMQNWDDAMFAAFLKNTNYNNYKLKDTAIRELGIEMIEYEEIAGERGFDQVHPADGTPYAASDACVNLRIWNKPEMVRALSNDPTWGQQFIYQLERQVGPAIQRGMNNKIWLDQQKLEYLSVEVERQLQTLEAQITSLAGGPVPLTSPTALGRVLLDLGVNIKERTGKTQVPATKKEILLKYRREHPIIDPIVQWKELNAQKTNYIDKLKAAVEHFGPLVRFQFQHIGVPTGRMKSGGSGKGHMAYKKGVVDVNIQSTPDPSKQTYLPNIRSAIVANDPRTNSREWCILAIDYNQMQLRIAANLSREPAWIQEFSKPKSDIHLKNAEIAYHRKIDKEQQEGKALRDKGKTISFAVLFGGNEYTVADHGGISIEQGKLLIDSFFSGARQLKSWIDSWIRMARSTKIVKTYFGRIRHLDEFYTDKVTDRRVKARLWAKGDREAVNSPIQGGEADIFKIACVKVDKVLEQRGWQNDCLPIAYMHDELVLRCRVSMLDTIEPVLRQTMEFPIKGWPVTMTTESEAGWDWGNVVKLSKFKEALATGKAPELEPGEEDSDVEEMEYEEELAEAMRDYGRGH